jgi:hypothetical protein
VKSTEEPLNAKLESFSRLCSQETLQLKKMFESGSSENVIPLLHQFFGKLELAGKEV